MGIYENRNSKFVLSEGCGCNKSTEQKKDDNKPIIPVIPTKPVEPEKPVSPKCWLVKPTHIVKIGDKVFITLDDCSFMEADASIIDSSVCKGMEENLSELSKKVKELSETVDKKANTEEVKESLNGKADKADLTKAVESLDTKADKTDLDTKANKADVDTLKEKVTTLEDKTKVLDTLEDIEYSDGNVSFRAFPKQ